MASAIDLGARASIGSALRATVLAFGGVDILVNTAAIYPPTDASGGSPEDVWATTLKINVTSNHVLVSEAAAILREQGLPASVVLTSSANAVVPKQGSEPYDVSKAALSHLVRELAVGLGPLIRVNGIAPATVVSGSAMFPRDRVIVVAAEVRDRLRRIGDDRIAPVEAGRVLRADAPCCGGRSCRRIVPRRSAGWRAIGSAKTTGHIIPVDGGLSDAFLR